MSSPARSASVGRWGAGRCSWLAGMRRRASHLLGRKLSAVGSGMTAGVKAAREEGKAADNSSSLSNTKASVFTRRTSKSGSFLSICIVDIS